MEAVTNDILKHEGYYKRYMYHLSTLEGIRKNLIEKEEIEATKACRIINIVYESEISKRSMHKLAYELTERELKAFFDQSKYTDYDSFMVGQNRVNKFRKTRRKEKKDLLADGPAKVVRF